MTDSVIDQFGVLTPVADQCFRTLGHQACLQRPRVTTAAVGEYPVVFSIHVSPH